MQKDVTVTAERTRAAPPRRAGPRDLGARRGFTLVEMLTILGLVGILTALSVAAVGPLRQSLQRHEAFHHVAAALIRAQQAAQSTGDCYYVELFKDFQGSSRRYLTPASVSDPTAQALLIRRLSFNDCNNPTLDLRNTSALEASLTQVEVVEMPYIEPRGQPDRRVWLANITSTATGTPAPQFPIIFRPNGRVLGMGYDTSINLFVIQPGETGFEADRRIHITDHGRICLFTDVIVDVAGGLPRCY